MDLVDSAGVHLEPLMTEGRRPFLPVGAKFFLNEVDPSFHVTIDFPGEGQSCRRPAMAITTRNKPPFSVWDCQSALLHELRATNSHCQRGLSFIRPRSPAAENEWLFDFKI